MSNEQLIEYGKLMSAVTHLRAGSQIKVDTQLARSYGITNESFEAVLLTMAAEYMKARQ